MGEQAREEGSRRVLGTMDRGALYEVIEEYWRARKRIDSETRETEDRECGEARVLRQDRVPLTSFKGLQGLLVERYRDRIQYAVSAVFRQPYSKLSKGVLLRLEDDFIPTSLTGNISDLVPGCELSFYGDEFTFRLGPLSECTIRYLEEGDAQLIELGETNMTCLATFAFLALSYDETGPFLEALVEFIGRALPFNPGEVQLAGYDDVVQRCENILSYSGGLTMKRNILLAGPPGCGKSMIMKRVALNHPEYVRCSLTKTRGWLEWLELFARVLSRCGRKMLVMVDEVDELGLTRDRDSDQVYELLRILDGLEDTRNLVVMASTNRLSDLDPALLRPGRLGPVIRVERPDSGQVKALVDYYGERYGASLDAERIVEAVGEEVSGADIRVSVEDCLIQGKPLNTENVIQNLCDLSPE